MTDEGQKLTKSPWDAALTHGGGKGRASKRSAAAARWPPALRAATRRCPLTAIGS